MSVHRLTAAQAEQARLDAERVWQGQWKHRIALLAVVYSLAELSLMLFLDTSIWDTSALLVFLGAVSVWMWVSHRCWFALLEKDLEERKLQTVGGRVTAFPLWWRILRPGLRFAVPVGNRILYRAPSAATYKSGEPHQQFFCLKRTGVCVPHPR